MSPIAPHPRRPRSGFTLLELLVVVAIIAVLAAMIVLGVRSALGKTVDRSTETRLEMLDGFLAAYGQSSTATGGAIGLTNATRLPTLLEAVPGSMRYYSTLDATVSKKTGDFADFSALNVPLAPPEIASATDAYIAVGQEYARTQAVLRKLLTVPANQGAFAALPDEAKTGVVPGGAAAVVNFAAAAPAPLSPPLMLDGHGHPIIFVPAAGMAGVTFKDAEGVTVTLVASDGRSFWASAGTDGLFNKGDDNVYSTPVIRK